ncbi:zinc finger, CCHC-type, retrotransposon gag domain protein [Tanacetum coccineum]
MTLMKSFRCLYFPYPGLMFIISLSLYPFTERYAQPYSFHVSYGNGRSDTSSERGVTIRGIRAQLSTCRLKNFDPMVNTRTDAELAAAVQAAVTDMLPQIREQVREEYRNGASGSGGNPPPVTIHTWLERFNKQKPRTFEKAVTPVDAENWISHMEKIFDVMGCDDVFKAMLAVYKFEGDALACGSLQAVPKEDKPDSHIVIGRCESSKEFMHFYIRKAGFLGQAAALQRNAAQQLLSIPSETGMIMTGLNDQTRGIRVGTSISRLISRIVTGVMTRGMTVMGQTGPSVMFNYRNNNSNNHFRDNNRNSGAGRDQRNRGQQSHRATNSGSQQNKAPSEGYTYPVCTTCGRRHPGECRRAAGTCFKCGQAGHLQRDCKKNTGASSSGHADKKPDASGRVFALTQDQAANATGGISDYYDASKKGLYHPGKANVVADALSRKSGMIAGIKINASHKDDGEIWAIIAEFRQAVPSFSVDMIGTVAQSIKGFKSVSKVKNRASRASGLLQPLEIPVWKWTKTSMDFVTGLPRLRGKHRRYRGDGPSQEIVRLTQRYSSAIISDRDPRFTSHFFLEDYRTAWDQAQVQIRHFIQRQTQSEISCLPIFGFNFGERVLAGPEKIEVTNEKSLSIQGKSLKKLRQLRKVTPDKHRRFVRNLAWKLVFWKVTPTQESGVFGIKGKLSPLF